MAEKKDKKGAKSKGRGDKGSKKKKALLPDKPRPPARLSARYKEELIAQLKKDLNLKSVSQVPKLE